MPNRLLGLLARGDYERLRPHLRPVHLDYEQSLYRAHRPIDWIYFIETGIGSLVTRLKDGKAAEIGTIGSEGVVGLAVILGERRAPTGVCVQVPGAALKMKASVFRAELARSAAMQNVMLTYAHAVFNQVAQSAVCNQLHSLEKRCCRWLLMTRDRMHADEFPLTQEFLAMMLGVKRTRVMPTVGALQRDDVIRYRRGNVTILDRPALERRACECYRVSRRKFDPVLGGKTARKPRAVGTSRKAKTRG